MTEGLSGMLSGLLGGKGGALIKSALQMFQEGAAKQGGLAGLLDQFMNAGLGEKADSWVGTGKNEAISGDEVEQALGSDKVDELAQKAGVFHDEAKEGMAEALPKVVDKVTPQGELPDTGSLQEMLAKLLSGTK
ncbi:YidB family protein [Pseudonocardia yunnanensis]|uniref:YidB family protein n=1 Tax=Pseudonocardia yunnanensis TaxID=58107 RepID=A0ABW4EN54_9PSEU